MALLGEGACRRASNYSYQLGHNFEIGIVSLNQFLASNEDMSYLAQSVDFIDDEFRIASLPTGHQFLEGIEFSRTVTIVFNETSEGKVKTYMQTWQGLNYNKTTRTFKSYTSITEKRSLGAWRDIIISAVNGYNVNTYYYKLKDAIPTSIGGLSFDYGNGDIMTRTVTFNFQDYEVVNLI